MTMARTYVRKLVPLGLLAAVVLAGASGVASAGWSGGDVEGEPYDWFFRLVCSLSPTC